MRTRRFLSFLIAALLAGSLAVPARAQEPPAAGPRLRRLANQLDLNETQRAKMREVGERQLRRGIQERADLEVARLDLHQLVRADKPDQHAIDAQVDKIAGMRAQLQKERLATLLEMRSMLTDAQRAKLRTLLESRDMRDTRRMREDDPMPDGGGPPIDD